nr:restriction endonuclease subunit S [Acidobacteriota bacterium]
MNKVKETSFGTVASDWNFIRADLFCQRVTDGTHDSPKPQTTGKHLITSKHIRGRDVDFDSAYLITEDEFNKINLRSKVDQWDVIISMIGEYCGFCYVERNESIEYAVKNVGLFKTGSKLKALWLYYFLNSKIGKSILEANKSGTSQPYLSLGFLRELPVLYPPTDNEAGQIVKVLSSLDDKIDLLHRQNKTLEALAETLFRQWFVEEVEENWEEFCLSDIADHIKDNINPSKRPDVFFRHYSLPVFDEGKEPKLEIGKDILSNKYRVVSDSILISKLNPRTPRVWVINGSVDEESSICSTEFQIVKPKQLSHFGFVYYFLKSYQVTNE